MQTKVTLLFSIVILVVLVVYIKDSRKRLWQNNSRQGRFLTIRSLLLIAVVIVILFFSLLR